MNKSETEDWLASAIPRHQNLSGVIENIIKNLLLAKNIDCLTVSSRTKTIDACLEKIERKKYKDPSRQLTDISGVRIVVYLESDIIEVSQVVEDAFRIDTENSLDQDSLLSTDQLGYRSVHFVCDIGSLRGGLPEFAMLGELKFEVQIRTVLQHAWAELAHDRNYKFSGSLPRPIERRLFLYAGMLEIADKGFSELSEEIDSYVAKVAEDTRRGNLSTEINSLSVAQFVEQWASNDGFALSEMSNKDVLIDIIKELTDFKIRTLDDLKNIIPISYKKALNELGVRTNIIGAVRDWMMIHDPDRFVRDVKVRWTLEDADAEILRVFLPPAKCEALLSALGERPANY